MQQVVIPAQISGIIFNNQATQKNFTLSPFQHTVWAGCLTHQDVRRLHALIFKTIRINCRDFSRIFRNKDLCEMSELRCFNLAWTVNDILKLHTLCTNPTNSILTTRLIQQSISFSRFPTKIAFADYSTRQIGGSSFINRSKKYAIRYHSIGGISIPKSSKRTWKMLYPYIRNHLSEEKGCAAENHLICI